MDTSNSESAPNLKEAKLINSSTQTENTFSELPANKQADTINITNEMIEEVSARYYEATSTASDTQTSPENKTAFSQNNSHKKVTATAESTNDPVTVIPEVIPAEGDYIPASQSQRIKGAAQMAAGSALAVAGVPLLILPGPGAVFIVGGVALASKGQRNFSGRAASSLESKLDTAAAKMAEIAKRQAKQAAQNAAKEAPHLAKNIAQQVPVVTKKVVKTAPVVAQKVADSAPVIAEKASKHAPVVADKIAKGATALTNTTLKAAPLIADKIAKSAPKAAEKVTQTAPEIAGKVIAGAPVVAESLAKGFSKGISFGANLLKQATAKAPSNTSTNPKEEITHKRTS